MSEIKEFKLYSRVMEVRDPIHGSLEFNDAEGAVIESAAFQRLRSIKQLGFAEYSFPGGVHNRFLHSLGVCHLAGLAFDSIFKNFQFASPQKKILLRQVTRLAALLHDVGHGPLSHATEEVMPCRQELNIKAYANRNVCAVEDRDQTQANHEDYTIKFVTDSHLSKILTAQFPDMEPYHVACLIDKTLVCSDDFFINDGVSLRNILSQLVSSEMDVDRMDYLGRDGYFCGTSYGAIETPWLLQNLTYHIVDGQMNLALNRRAIYTFDDFLISRHHIHLIVYYHHKSVIYEELLYRYLKSKDCSFFLPADIEEYLKYNDFFLYEHLSSVDNRWAKRISQKKPFKVLFEQHVTEESTRTANMESALNAAGIETIPSSSKVRLSKYHGASIQDQMAKIYVVDGYDRHAQPVAIDECTEIFKRYEETRIIERIYVAPEQYDEALGLIKADRL